MKPRSQNQGMDLVDKVKMCMAQISILKLILNGLEHVFLHSTSEQRGKDNGKLEDIKKIFYDSVHY